MPSPSSCRVVTPLLLALCLPSGLASGLAEAQTKSTKRGVAYGYHSADDMKALSKGISWWYNWALTPVWGAASVAAWVGVTFSPMAWGGAPTADQIVV